MFLIMLVSLVVCVCDLGILMLVSISASASLNRRRQWIVKLPYSHYTGLLLSALSALRDMHAVRYNADIHGCFQLIFKHQQCRSAHCLVPAAPFVLPLPCLKWIRPRVDAQPFPRRFDSCHECRCKAHAPYGQAT